MKIVHKWYGQALADDEVTISEIWDLYNLIAAELSDTHTILTEKGGG